MSLNDAPSIESKSPTSSALPSPPPQSAGGEEPGSHAAEQALAELKTRIGPKSDIRDGLKLGLFFPFLIYQRYQTKLDALPSRYEEAGHLAGIAVHVLLWSILGPSAFYRSLYEGWFFVGPVAVIWVGYALVQARRRCILVTMVSREAERLRAERRLTDVLSSFEAGSSGAGYATTILDEAKGLIGDENGYYLTLWMTAFMGPIPIGILIWRSYKTSTLPTHWELRGLVVGVTFFMFLLGVFVIGICFDEDEFGVAAPLFTGIICLPVYLFLTPVDLETNVERVRQLRPIEERSLLSDLSSAMEDV